MRKGILLLLGVFAIVMGSCTSKRSAKPKVLVFFKTSGFEHASIPKGIAAIQELGTANNFDVDTTSNSERFTEDTLKDYASIIFLSTTGEVLNTKQEAAFERYIQSGGGFVGVHAATDTEYDWNWYGQLVGAYFISHPPGTQEANFVVKDNNFIATDFLTDSLWIRTDELYNFKKINPNIKVLITIDENSYEGGTNGEFHPMSWYHEYDGGRSFYTAMGHTDESYEEENFLKHLLGGIQYTISDNAKPDYTKVTSQFPPDADRFAKNKLVVGDFHEPTEMTILPNLDILVVQRRGEILLYKQSTGQLQQVGALDVYYKTLNTPGVNAEEGLMGLQKDPNFEENNWIYMYYSPSGDKWINRLSRFTFKDDTLDMASEKIILEVDSQREICCHTGGSIAFGGDGLLYLSTGDNSTPFNEGGAPYVNSGFAPQNDLPGRQQYDARRSSGNTNDLRGKILRIKVNDDGSYDIPDGNLFPKGTDKTRPEIYTMGHRNPYRIAVDQKNGYLYWGDVGPDARADSLATRGPRGYDEVGQAKTAGNYGWPLFIADNKAYHQYDYATGISGAAYDPEKPMNTSRNNTGLVELPPAQEAFLWYPYAESGDFPQLGSGGRNAMAGGVFYADLYEGALALPDYYDGKLIIYDFMRGWMKAVSLFPNGDFNKMEPFAQDIELNALIDMELGPDGQIYLLEYGSGWFTKNDDTALSVLQFNGGNRPPVINSLELNKTSGSVPFAINATVDARDREGDPVKYVWDLGNGEVKETTAPELAYTYEEAGEFKIEVTAKDDSDASAKSNAITVYAGNTKPEVTITITEGNKSFFVAGRPISYEVSVTDADSGSINNEDVFVSVDYLEGFDEASLSLGHQEASVAVSGEALTQSLDCKTCHKINEVSIGPSYQSVSERYQNDPNATTYLANRMVEGGGGVWGEVIMPAHPNLTKEETNQITTWIMSLADTSPKRKSLPASGTIVPEPSNANKTLVLTASYTDQGNNSIKPLTGSKSIALSSSAMTFTGTEKKEGFMQMKFNGTEVLIFPTDSGWFALENIDLTGVSSAMLMAGWQGDLAFGLTFEVHIDAPDGPVIGKGSMPKPPKGQPGGAIFVPLKPVTDGQQHELYFTYTTQDPNKQGITGAIVGVTFGGQ